MKKRLEYEFFNSIVMKTLEKGSEFGEVGITVNKVSGKRSATTIAGKLSLLGMLTKEDYLKIIGFFFNDCSYLNICRTTKEERTKRNYGNS